MPSSSLDVIRSPTLDVKSVVGDVGAVMKSRVIVVGLPLAGLLMTPVALLHVWRNALVFDKDS
jgi:hypothetical protein